MHLLDGPVLLREAIDAGAAIESVYVESDALADPTLAALLPAVTDAGGRTREVRPGTLAKVLDLRSPQSVVAVVRLPVAQLAEVITSAHVRARPILVLVELADPGNVGTMVRVAEATGCAGVVMTERCADPFAPKAVRASAGAILRVPTCVEVDLVGLLEQLDVARVPAVATAGSGSETPEHTDLLGAVAVLVGSEAHGLAPEVVRRCSHVVAIPMEGSVESLNAAVAGSVVLFESARQRRVAAASTPGGATDVPTRSHTSRDRAPSMGHNDATIAPGSAAAEAPAPGHGRSTR